MAADYRDILLKTAKELDDVLTDKIDKGGHSTVYFGRKYVYKITEKKVMEKSSTINSILSSSNNRDLFKHVPKTVLFKELKDNCLVVEELKEGLHPKEINFSLLKEIVEVLKSVHSIEIDQLLTNFEGDKMPVSKYWVSQVEFAEQYALRLKESQELTIEDLALIESCLDKVKEISSTAKRTPRLVMVYKDVHKHNTLINRDGKLSGLIDWDAAMSGPVELEYAVLWSRFPEVWEQIKPQSLDTNIFIVSGIVQGLRFWKSFTKDSRYVDQQRDSLRKLLEL